MRREHQGVILLRASRSVRRQNKSRERIDDPRQEDLMVPLLQGVELIRGGLSDGLLFSSERFAFPLCLAKPGLKPVIIPVGRCEGKNDDP